MKNLYFTFSFLFSFFSSAQNITQHSDTIFSGQPIEVITNSFVKNNGPPPTSCSPLCTISDTLINGDILMDLTHDYSGPQNSGCWKKDTFRLNNYPPGTYKLYCSWYVTFNCSSSMQQGVRNYVDSVMVTILNSTGLKENKVAEITISPNPANEFFKINGLENEIKQVELYALSGKKVKDYFKQTQKFELVGLEKGIYFVRITTEKGRITKKLVVAK